MTNENWTTLRVADVLNRTVADVLTLLGVTIPVDVPVVIPPVEPPKEEPPKEEIPPTPVEPPKELPPVEPPPPPTENPPTEPPVAPPVVVIPPVVPTPTGGFRTIQIDGQPAQAGWYGTLFDQDSPESVYPHYWDGAQWLWAPNWFATPFGNGKTLVGNERYTPWAGAIPKYPKG